MTWSTKTCIKVEIIRLWSHYPTIAKYPDYIKTLLAFRRNTLRPPAKMLFLIDLTDFLQPRVHQATPPHPISLRPYTSKRSPQTHFVFLQGTHSAPCLFTFVFQQDCDPGLVHGMVLVEVVSVQIGQYQVRTLHMTTALRSLRIGVSMLSASGLDGRTVDNSDEGLLGWKSR